MLAYFTDPILRGPTIGCMLMSMAASLVGVFVFVQKRSLLGEALSHAAYPGVTVGVLVSAFLFPDHDEMLASCILIGAFLSAILGLKLIDKLEKRFKVRKDSALCLILSSFFGIGLTIASRLQVTHPQEYKQIQVYLYGQAATMTDSHIYIYGILSITIFLIILLFYKELQALTFDFTYARSIGIPIHFVQSLIYFLIVLAVVVGIRSVGVVLMSAMLIAPAVAARQYTNKLSVTLLLAAIFGLLSGFLGNYSSTELSEYFEVIFPSKRLVLPTGPMIVLSAAFFCFFGLFFAPQSGMVIRLWRIYIFRYQCLQENVLKAFWRFGEGASASLKELTASQQTFKPYLWWILSRLKREGWLESTGKNSYHLTDDGRQRASHIVRLHRLWEVYLVEYLGVGAERVHCNAEEIEHILTPELEKELTILLANPKQDPHSQPIPRKEETL